jgi:hypothetical protein
MLELYILDSEAEKPLAGQVSVDYDYQAEQHVQDLVAANLDRQYPLISFILCDGDGIRCVWTRTAEEAAKGSPPVIIKVTERFQGQWERAVESVQAITPSTYYELVVATRHFLS